MELGDKSFTPQEPLLIDKINGTLKMLGSTMKWKRAPEVIKGAEVLKDKKIAMVDDEQGVLESFVPDLMTATDGKAAFIKYEGQSIDELTKQIQDAEADLVLLDYHLSEVLKGSDVARALTDNGFSGDMVGFSSDPGAASDFKKEGALGSVDKKAWSPEVSVEQVAQLLDNKG